MRSFNWKKTTLLGFVAAALATGCSAEPGSSNGFDPVASPDPEVGTSKARISQIGEVASTAGTSTALFDVMSTISNLDYIAVNAADLAAQNVRVSVFAVDETGAMSLLSQKAVHSASTAAQTLDQASTDLSQVQSSVIAQSASHAAQGSSASTYQATSAESIDSVVSSASDVSQVVAEEHSAAAHQAAEQAAAQRQSAAYAASADQAAASRAAASNAAAASQNVSQLSNIAQTVSSFPLLGGLSSGFGLSSGAFGFGSVFDTAAANAANAVEAADASRFESAAASSVDQAAASDLAASSSSAAAAESLDAVAARTAAHQSTAAQQVYHAANAQSIATADQVSYAEHNALATRDAASIALHQSADTLASSTLASLDQTAVESLQQSQFYAKNATTFDQLQSAQTNHFMVQVSWDTLAQSAHQSASQFASALDSISAFQSAFGGLSSGGLSSGGAVGITAFPTIGIWGGLADGAVVGRAFSPGVW